MVAETASKERGVRESAVLYSSVLYVLRHNVMLLMRNQIDPRTVITDQDIDYNITI